MHGFEDEQSAFTLLVPLFQHSLFATPCAQSATPHGVLRFSAAFAITTLLTTPPSSPLSTSPPCNRDRFPDRGLFRSPPPIPTRHATAPESTKSASPTPKNKNG